MKRVVGSLLGSVLLLIVSGAGVAADEPVRVMAGTPATPVGRLMGEEVKTYFGKLFTNPVEFRQEAESCQVVLGTPESNGRIRDLIRAGKLTLPQGKNADQGYAIKTVDQTLHVAASTEIGLLYGVYALLEAYGAYFQISGDCLPVRAPFTVKPLDVCVAPAFKYRGIMPWDNFLCGSSGYNEEDWHDLIMRATRMKYNKLDLHFYPGYVYYNEVWDGKPVPPRWAAQPGEFAPKGKPGAKAFGDTKLFCVRNWEENKGDPVRQAEASQAMLRRVIDFAHERGWVVAAGFALMHPRGGGFVMTRKGGDRAKGGVETVDPLQEKNVELSLQRYRRLQQIYPNADYYWMWQTEGGGGMYRRVGEEPGAREMREQYASWSGRRGAEGDIDYAYLFRQVAERLTPAERARLATGGWSIEHLFPGIQKDYPKDVIFASLNNASPDHAVSALDNYRVAREGRRAWMIAWWEFDGNQWFPQFRTTWHEKKYKTALEHGVESVSLLGWKLSAIEHHLRYLAEFAWNPALTAKDFYADFARRIYGQAGVEPIARLYGIYDEWEARTPPATPADDRPMLLGAGWCSLALPDVPFAKEALAAAKWKHTVMRAGKIIELQEQLRAEDQRSVAVLKSVLPSLPPDGRQWAKLLINRFEFRILYLQATEALNRALVVYDRVANTEGMQAGASAAKKETEQSLQMAARAIEKYAEEVRNRGDLGLIGQLNVQFYDLIAQMDGRFRLNSPYVTVNWTALRMNVNHRSDLTQANCWPLRDGVAGIVPFMDNGQPALRVSLAGTPGVKWGSRFIRKEAFDLEQQPLMDFWVRTTTKDPVALMFQVEGQDNWFELDLIGKQGYRQLDKISPLYELSNGAWHRVTWNLKKLVAEQIGPDIKSIKNVVVGTWSNPAQPVVLEFRNVCFGSFNQLDGLELDL